MRDLFELVDRSNASYSQRFSESLLDEMVDVGDPVADRAIATLDEDAYDPDGSQLTRLRALADAGDHQAQEFFYRSQRRPDWLEPDLIERGQRLGLAFAHHYGVSLMHSLFAGGLFARAALVTQSTGRLGSDPARRIQETGAFIAAILQPGGLEPGALGFETAVRVRLLHGSIRSWLNRSPGFSDAYFGTPLDQTMLAMTLSLFDYLNLRSIVRLGVPLSDDDLRAHHHLWRYIGHLLGIDERLLTTSLEEERELWSALVAHQAFPELLGEEFLGASADAVGVLLAGSTLSAPLVRKFLLHLSGPGWYGMPEESSTPNDSMLDPLIQLLCTSGTVVGLAHRWLPGVEPVMVRYGAFRLSKAEEMARSHGFGVELDEEDVAKREADFHTLAAGVRKRFEHRAEAHSQ